MINREVEREKERKKERKRERKREREKEKVIESEEGKKIKDTDGDFDYQGQLG